MDQLTTKLESEGSKPVFISQGYVQDRKFYLDKSSKLYKDLERRCSDTNSAGSIFSCNINTFGLKSELSEDENYKNKNYYLMITNILVDQPVLAKIVVYSHTQANNSRYLNLGFIPSICHYLCSYLDLTSLFILNKDEKEIFEAKYEKIDHLNFYKYKKVRTYLARLFYIPGFEKKSKLYH